MPRLFPEQIPAILLAVFVLNFPPVSAQNAASTPSANANAPNQVRKKTNYKSKYVTKAFELPGIPTYPGKNSKLLRAVELPNLGKGNITVLQSFLVKDPPEQVRDYYVQQLSDNKWNPKSGNRTNTQLQGSRDSEHCQVMVNPAFSSSQGSGYKTMLQIRYTKAGSSLN